jgi:hypothetical protein
MSAKLTALIGAEVRTPFGVFDLDGVTPLSGLVNADFTNKTVIRDGTDESGSVSLVVTEIGSTGKYYTAFTPNARGLWYIEVTTPLGDVLGSHIDVGFFNSLETLRKETANAHKVDLLTQEVIAYDDDGTTPVQRWDLFTDGGEDVVTVVGVQTRRGPAKLPRS